MRNLKRALSLALAGVMLMGMMVVGAGAASSDFTDAGEIKNVEAVDVMVALGVLEGGDKGDFQPNSILTREQAAKIICYMLLGTENAEKLATSGSVFSDVAADRWSAPFIGYCVNLGILAGDGNGHFFPEGKLTGAAFAKMLLVALGYDPAIEKYTGNEWTINVAGDAIEAGIAPKGLVLTDELSRQDAAQMAFQTLTANMVRYDNKGTTITNADGSTIVIGATPAEAVEVNGEDSTTNYDRRATGAAGVGYKQFCEKYFPDLTKDTGTDDFNRDGYTWYNGTHGNSNDAVGTYADAADYTVVISKDTKTLKYWAEQANKKLTFTGTTYTGRGMADPADNAAVLNVGDVLELFVDGNNVEKAIVIRHTADVITEVDTEVKDADAEDGVTAYITFETAGTFNNTDIPGYNADTYVEDAVVAIVMNGSEIIDSYVCESVEGAITAYTTTTYTMNGTKYTLTGTADNEIAGDVDFDEGSYKLYLDANGYVIKTEVVEGSITINDVFYLADIHSSNVYWVETETVKGKTTNSYYVQAVYLDGTVEDIKVAEAEDTTAKDTAVETYLNGLNAGFYTKDANTVTYESTKTYDVTLSAWSDTDYTVSPDLANGSLEITADTKKLNGAYLNSDTKYVVVESYDDDVKVTVKTGSISYEDEAGDVVLAISKTVNGSPVVQYVVIVSDTFTAAATGDYFYVDDATATTVSGGTQYTVYNKAGEETTIVVDEDSTKKSLEANKFYEFAEMTNGNYDVKGELDADVVDTTIFDSYYGDSLTVTDNAKVIDTADAAIVDVHDTDGDYSKSITTLAAMQAAKKAGYNVNLKVVYTDTKKEAAQFIVVTSVVKGNSVVVTPGEAAATTDVAAPAEGGTIVLKGSVKAGMPEDAKGTMGNKVGTDFSIVRVTLPTEFNVDGLYIKQTNAALSRYYSTDENVTGNVKLKSYNWNGREESSTLLVMILDGGSATLEFDLEGCTGAGNFAADYTYVIDGSGLELVTE